MKIVFDFKESYTCSYLYKPVLIISIFLNEYLNKFSNQYFTNKTFLYSMIKHSSSIKSNYVDQTGYFPESIIYAVSILVLVNSLVRWTYNFN